jgi:glycosyltransferase involved in cell wall biosynthesis
MKILIATPLYSPEIGGPATHTSILERELPKRGIYVNVLAFREVKHLPKIIRHISYFFKVLKRGKEVDIIYTLDPVSVGLPASLAAKILRKRFIVRIAGDYAWEQGVRRFNVNDLLDDFYRTGKTYFPPVVILKRIQRHVANSAEKIIVPSKYLKKIVGKWGVPLKTIHVVYNSFEESKLAKNKRTLRGLLRFKGKIIVSAGRLVPWKGFKTLVEIMPVIIKEIPNVKLLILGDGPLQEILEERIHSSELEDTVILGGAVSKDVLTRYIEASDAFVLNTSYEGFSHQLLEVMNIGVPIVTTNVGGNPELVTNNKDGLLIPYDNKKLLSKALVDVLSSLPLKRKLIANAKKTVSKFSEERMIEALIKEFK